MFFVFHIRIFSPGLAFYSRILVILYLLFSLPPSFSCIIPIPNSYILFYMFLFLYSFYSAFAYLFPFPPFYTFILPIPYSHTASLSLGLLSIPPYSSYSAILSFSPFPPFHPSILLLPHSYISFLPLSPFHSRIFPSLFTPPPACSSCYSPACLNNPFESSLLRGSISVSLVSFVFPSQHRLVCFRPVLSSPARIPIT